MELLCTSLLLLLIGHVQGVTHFFYRKKNERVRMDCKHKRWQIDLDYDQQKDCDLTLKRDSSEERTKCKGCSQIDTTNMIQSINTINCDLTIKDPEKTNGIFACGDTFSRQKTIYPFKPIGRNNYFILAFANLNVLTSLPQTEKNTQINKHEGDPINLSCNFNISANFAHSPYVVYWIKTVGDGSTCVYSYEYEFSGIHYDKHCYFQNNFLTRVSNTTSDNPTKNPHFHNLTIYNGTYSDSGQYVCALNVMRGREGNWVVISNVTVTVDKNTIQHSPKVTLTPLYLVVAIVIISIFVIAMYMKKKTIIAKESQPVSKKRHQNGDGTINPDISPYAVAGRQLEPYSVVNLTAKPADHSVEGDQAKLPIEPYYIFSITPQCKTLGSSPLEDWKLKHSEKPMDTGAHVYESINDTYSTCK